MFLYVFIGADANEHWAREPRTVDESPKTQCNTVQTQTKGNYHLLVKVITWTIIIGLEYSSVSLCNRP